MKFNEILNAYIQELGCTAKELCEKSGISGASLSRYRSGERILDSSSEIFDNLCSAIAEIGEKSCIDIRRDDIRKRFLMAEDLSTVDSKLLMQNFDTLVSMLDISINHLCRNINYDVSAVFRFRNGTRKPADPIKFASSVAGYVVREFDSLKDIVVLSELLSCDKAALTDSSVRFERLTEWLLSGKNTQKDVVSAFLNKLDEFDLNEYIRAIHFDEFNVPTAPFLLPTSKTYFGLNEMMEGELDFLKATALAKTTEPVTMYSDMPMTEMAKDPEFPKKWMFGMAMLLKKGLHLNMIHNVDRSFEEMMLGLESYIPMYMTGQITPYYIKNNQSSAFLNLLKVSGVAALAGEAIEGHHSDGKYYLTKSKKEVSYYSKRAAALLSCATPLMNIFRSDNANELKAFQVADAESNGKRRSILSTLPVYTIDKDLLESMLSRNDLTDEEKQQIRDCVDAKRGRVEHILENNHIDEEISDINEREFKEHPATLEISGAFCEKDIYYTYDEYLAHLKSTEQFEDSHPNYTLKKTSAHAFRNLQIVIHEGKWAMISKGKAPAIHFVIYHPKLEKAIEQFIPPIVEK